VIEWIAASVFCFSALLALGLVVLSLPGVWMLAVLAVGTELLFPELLSGWTIAAVLALAVVAEVVDTLASAAGAKKAGGSRRAMFASIFGAIVGGILGTIVVPILGTIVGAVLGAGIAAGLLESTKRYHDIEGDSTRSRAWNVGVGAAKGRAVAILVKGVIALVVGGILIGGALG
jgi:hypothetical protein